MTLFKCIPLTTYGALLALCHSLAAAQFGDLTQRVTNGANTIMLIDVKRIHESLLATGEAWSNRHDEAFQADRLLILPAASRFVGAAEFKSPAKAYQCDGLTVTIGTYQ